MATSISLHLDLDGAWERNSVPFEAVDVKAWGPRLRFSAPTREVEDFYREIEAQLTPFLLYGSGDFHHLTALWLRRVDEPVTVISFDNHPDWDIRPPKWCCGGWVNRALELSQVRKVSVWGCGNFEPWGLHKFFGNRRAEREGRLEIHPWADDRPASDRQRRGAIVRQDWQRRFLAFAKELAGEPVYVTIDLDCLRAEEAVTNWENGRFTVDDLEWALRELRNAAQVVGGDICGAFSTPRYARLKQRFASEFDHPKLNRPEPAEICRINTETLRRLWPLLTE